MLPQFIRDKLVRHLSKLKSPQNAWMDNIFLLPAMEPNLN